MRELASNFEAEHAGRFCAKHKVRGMVDVNNKKRHEQTGCSTLREMINVRDSVDVK